MELLNKYTQDYSVLPSACDFGGNLGIYETFRLFMDLANSHAEILGIDQKKLMDRGLFWLTVKTRIRFFRRAQMQKRLKAETWPLAPLSLRTDRCYRLSDENGPVAEGRTEWAVLDMKAGRLAQVKTVFPENLVFNEDRVSFEDFPRIGATDDSFTDRGTFKVTSSDIDMGNHMNNAAYVRALLGFFGSAELTEMDIREMTVIFKTSAHEGDVLSMKEKKTDAGYDCGLFFGDGKPAVLAQIVC